MAKQTPKRMERHVRDALLEYLASIAVGSIPLLGHGFFSLFSGQLFTSSHPWTPELFFLTMTTAGGSVLSVFIRFFCGRLSRDSLTFSGGVLWIICLFLALAAAIGYGMFAIEEQVREIVPRVALGVAVLSIISSVYLELSMARATVFTQDAAPMSEAKNPVFPDGADRA